DREMIIRDNYIELAELVDNYTADDVQRASLLGRTEILSIMRKKHVDMSSMIPADPNIPEYANWIRVNSARALVPVLKYEELYLQLHALDQCDNVRRLPQISATIK